MRMVVELLREQKLNFGVVVNKSNLGNNDIYEYMEKEGIELLENIEFREEFARIIARGDLLVDHSKYVRNKMSNIIKKVLGDTYA